MSEEKLGHSLITKTPDYTSQFTVTVANLKLRPFA